MKIIHKSMKNKRKIEEYDEKIIIFRAENNVNVEE